MMCYVLNYFLASQPCGNNRLQKVTTLGQEITQIRQMKYNMLLNNLQGFWKNILLPLDRAVSLVFCLYAKLS